MLCSKGISDIQEERLPRSTTSGYFLPLWESRSFPLPPFTFPRRPGRRHRCTRMCCSVCTLSTWKFHMYVHKQVLRQYGARNMGAGRKEHQLDSLAHSFACCCCFFLGSGSKAGEIDWSRRRQARVTSLSVAREHTTNLEPATRFHDRIAGFPGFAPPREQQSCFCLGICSAKCD